jgi:hypothetical protein
MESIFHEEVGKLCDILAKKEGQAISLQVSDENLRPFF